MITWPKTTCLPLSQGVWEVHRKNWEPLVLGPALAYGGWDASAGMGWVRSGVNKRQRGPHRWPVGAWLRDRAIVAPAHWIDTVRFETLGDLTL